MFGFTVNDVVNVVSGKLFGAGDSIVTNIVIDSRKVENGSLFAAIKGQNVDGHAFIGKAFELGASCCLCSKIDDELNIPQILVEDVPKAMRQLSEAFRKKLSIPVVGITGSVGKTTTKEMVYAVLSAKYNTLKTEKNFNNELGVPMTVSQISDKHEAAVIEMGISDFNEMSVLAKIVRPNYEVITTIGHAHLENLIDRDGVLKAKTEFVEYMPDSGVIFVNGDDDKLATYTSEKRIVRYGTTDCCDVKAEKIVFSESSTKCRIIADDRNLEIEIPAYGLHMVSAAAAAVAVGIELGLNDDEIIKGISEYETVGRRSNVEQTGFVTLVDDCYNANPDSVKCGIDSLAALSGRKLCILGDMLELGDNKESLHYEIGKYAANNGIELVLTVGELSKNITDGCKDNGIKSIHYDSNSQLIEELLDNIKKGDAILVKASHSMKFEEISEAIKRI